MALVLLESPRKAQPALPVGVNRQNEFGRRCVLAWSANHRGVNQADGLPASYDDPRGHLVGGPLGLSTSDPGGSQQQWLRFPGAPTETTFPITFLCLFRTFSGGNAISFLSTANNGNGFGLGCDSSHQMRALLGNGGGGLYFSSPVYLTIPFNDADYMVFACSYNPATGAARAVMRNMTTGAVEASSGAYSYTNWGAGDGQWFIGNTAGAGTQKVLNHGAYAAMLQFFETEQLVELVREPFQIWAPDFDVLHVPSAGAPPSFQAAWAGAASHMAMAA